VKRLAKCLPWFCQRPPKISRPATGENRAAQLQRIPVIARLDDQALRTEATVGDERLDQPTHMLDHGIGERGGIGVVAKQPHGDTIHSIFKKLPVWQGMVPSGFRATCVGSFVRNIFHGGDARSAPYFADALIVDEEIFEWIDLLEAINAARESFTMVELGAGYGRWIVAAAVALRRHRVMPFRLIGVEAEPNHFEMMKQHLRDNGFVPENHTLINAAITPTGRPVHFIVGHSDSWYGQAIIPEGYSFPDFPDARAVEVPGISLEEVLEPLDRVDLCDIDIQGAEADIVECSIDVLSSKVSRLHIGTHSTQIETRLHRVLSSAEWCCVRSYPHSSQTETELGRIEFVDGVQSWLNRRLLQARVDYGPSSLSQSTGGKRPEREMSRTAIDLDTFRVGYANASATLEGTEMVIETAPDPWSYAAAVDLLAHKIKQYFVTEIDLEVEGGTVYAALTSRDLTDVGQQKPINVTGGEKRTIYLEDSKANGRLTILVRNGPNGGVCRVRITEIRVYN
jgi:FkbM family methyltransferase